MRRFLHQPFFATMSAMLLIVLAACGFGARAAQGHRFPAPNTTTLQAVDGAISATALILAFRAKVGLQALNAASQAQPRATATHQTDTAQSAPDGTSAATALPHVIVEFAALVGMLLSAVVAPSVNRPRGVVSLLPLRRITEHRIAPAP